MKSILISIKPQWCELIANGKKTVEVRKSRPKIETPFKCYIYCTKEKDGLISLSRCLGKLNPPFYQFDGKVIGEFICDEILTDKSGELADVFERDALLLLSEQKEYGKNGILYGWHISDLVIYDEPMNIEEFEPPCPTSNDDACLRCGYLARTEVGNMCIKQITRPPQSWCYVEED